MNMGNIYWDFFWMFIALAGMVYFYGTGNYWSLGIFLFLGLLYFSKVISETMKSNNKK